MIKGANTGIKWRNDGTGLGDADCLPDGVVMHDGVYRLPIKGAKAGQQSQRQPVIAKDSAASISYLKILYGLSEGEISGLADGAKSIYLDDTPLIDDNGNPNFKDDNGNLAVTWDFRSGTNDQEYIKGFPSVENETNINVELKGGTPYVKTVTNSQLSAVRLRLSWSALRKQETNGDVNGITIEYAIDLSTNGGAYQQVLLTKVSDKTSAKYERSHRIDLPRGNTWNIRVRRITPNATSDLISDKMYVDAITEIIDAKLRYPNTAMLGLQYDAATFSNIAKLAVRCKGKIISVPSNYDPVARTYNGIWDGTFKQAYSNNPAWVYYDICTQWRYGLGSRITAAMIDKWSLYTLAQYCDEKVSDGRGGQEPRFTVNVYLQAQQDAFTVLQSLAAIFRAMSYWQGEQIVLDADLPKDPVYTFSRANVVDGDFSYTGTRARDRHTIAKVAWDNPEQKFKTEYEFVRDEAAIAKYGVKVLDLSIVGCTSQGQAQRAGLWALKSEQLETRTVTFKTGLDGFIPTVGSIINVSDEVLAGRANGGRVSAVSSDFLTVTLDRDVVVSVSDTLIVNADNGKAQRRIVSAVNGRAVTVSVAFTGISSQNVWAVDSSDLKTMRFRVLSIKQDDVTFTITALQHEPQKYDAIDYGAIVEPTAISIIKPNIIDAPKNVAITQRNRVEQGQNITTMIVSWEQVSGAVAYDVEWRKDNGNWIKVPRTGNNSIEIDGVYSGNYLARVAAVSAFDLVSNFATSILTAVTGKVGAPPSLANLKATGILFGMQLDWLFAQGSSDTNYTEIQVASAPDTNVALLGTYAYPTNTATINGLQGNLTQYYRGRIVDKLGNASPWTAWVKGVTSADASKVLDLLNGQITESQLYQDLGAKIGKISTIETGLSQEIKDRVAAVKVNTEAIAAERDARIADIKTNSDAINQETQNRIAAVKSVSDGLTQEIIDRQNGDTETLQVITTYKASNDNALAAVQSDVRTVTTAQSATASKLDGVYAIATPLTADSNQWKADSGSKQATSWTLQSAIVDGDSALSSRIDVLTAGFNRNSAAITSEQTARADADSATASILQKVQADLEGKASTGAVSAVDSNVTELSGKVTAATTKLDGVYAIATPLTADSNQWKADSGSKQATSWTLQSAIVDGDRVISERIDTVQTTVNGNTASIQTQQQSINGLYAQYTVKVDVNGRVSGFGLASSNTQSDFVIRADKFYIAPPTGADKGVLLFAVQTTPTTINGVSVPAGAYIKGDLIATGSVTADKIDTRGLTIKDATGKVLFGSGTGLDVTNITGLGSLATKSSLTSSDIGGLGTLATKDKVTTNEVTGLGTLATKSSLTTSDVGGLGTLATKNSVTTSEVTGLGGLATKSTVSTGEVTGLGALATKSTVTTNEVTGLGDLAKVNKLTTSNITTYVDGLGVKNLLVGDAQITSANIGTAQVDTLQIAGEAVIVPRAQYNPNDLLIKGNGDQIKLSTASLETIGNVVSISLGFERIYGSFNAATTSTYTFYIKLYRNGVEIKAYKIQISSVLTENITTKHSIDSQLLAIPNFLDTPSSGINTYEVYASWGASSSSVRNESITVTGASIQLLGVKR